MYRNQRKTNMIKEDKSVSYVKFRHIFLILLVIFIATYFIFINDSLDALDILLIISLTLGLISSLLLTITVINKNKIRGRINKCENTIITSATLGHFSYHTMITILFYYMTDNIFLSIYLSFSIAILWEFFEYAISDKYRAFACESKWNTIFDVIFAILGSMLVLFFVDFSI